VTGVAQTTGVETTTGSGNPMEKPKRTPALADIAATPTSMAMRIIFVFIVFIFWGVIAHTIPDD